MGGPSSLLSQGLLYYTILYYTRLYYPIFYYNLYYTISYPITLYAHDAGDGPPVFHPRAILLYHAILYYRVYIHIYIYIYIYIICISLYDIQLHCLHIIFEKYAFVIARISNSMTPYPRAVGPPASPYPTGTME